MKNQVQKIYIFFYFFVGLIIVFPYIKAKEKKFTIESHDFREGEFLKDEFTPQGADRSPSLAWKNIPKKTKSFALSVEDPDAPSGTFYHWLVINIPKNKTSIKKNENPGTEIENSNKIKKYKGPHPPKGNSHRYFFKIFALDVEKIQANNNISFYKEINKHKIAEASIIAYYQIR